MDYYSIPDAGEIIKAKGRAPNRFKVALASIFFYDEP